MSRFLFLAGLLFGVLSTQAEAKTIRYEFDIVSSWLSLGTLYKYDDIYSGKGFEASIANDDPLYGEVVSAIHPLGHLKGQTGHISLDLTGDIWGIISSINCLSGILCADFDRMNELIRNGRIPSPSFSSTGFMIYAWNAIPSGEWYMRLNDPEAGTGSISFTDDQMSGLGWFNGTEYMHSGAVASFMLANFSATEIAPVPLPAGAPLLAAGVLALGLGARRRKRAA